MNDSNLEITLERLKNTCHYILPIDSETRQAEIDKNKKNREMEGFFNKNNKNNKDDKNIISNEINKPPTLKVAKVKKEDEVFLNKLKDNNDNFENINKIEDDSEDEDYIEEEDFDEIKSNLAKIEEQKLKNPIIQNKKHYIDVNVEKSIEKEKINLNNPLNKKEILNPIPKMQTKINIKNQKISNDNNVENININSEDNIKVISLEEKDLQQNKKINSKKAIPKVAKPINNHSKPVINNKTNIKNDKIKNRKVKFNQNLLEIAKEKNREQNQKKYKNNDDVFDSSKENAFKVFDNISILTSENEKINKSKNIKKSSSIEISPLKDDAVKEIYYDTMKDSFNIKDSKIESKKNAIKLKQQAKTNENAYANFRQNEAKQELKNNQKENSLMKNFKPRRKK